MDRGSIMDGYRAVARDGQRTSSFAVELVAQMWRDRLGYAIALTALYVAFLVGPLVNAKPDVTLVLSFLSDIGIYALLLLSLAAGVMLLRLGLVHRSQSPARDLAAMVGQFAIANGRGPALISAIFVQMGFSIAFAVLKAAIALLRPFTFDRAFSDMDRFLHFGVLPHDWLLPLFGSPTAILGLNVAYHVWFGLLLTSFFATGMMTGRLSVVRMQYMLAFLMLWFFGGFVIATLLSSAGPAFFERIGAGADYAPLMAHLEAVNAVVPVWALHGHEALWDGFVGLRDGFAGISAMPSMHIGTATLFALAGNAVDRRLGYVLWAYAGVIMVGSVVLAWHYAVDGYAAALLAIGLWKLAGRIARRMAGRAS